MSKGSSPRPFSVSNEEYAKRWDMIFGRDLKKEDDEKAEQEELEIIQHQQQLNKEKK